MNSCPVLRPNRLRTGSPWARVRLIAMLIGALLPSVEGWAAWPLFESGPVRPVALSPDGSRLFVANLPDAHLEIYDVDSYGVLSHAASVPVGLDPVTVVARTDAEVWVVNHMSDSISIVDVAAVPPRVLRTLLVGDEPRDLVFAGTPERAFVTTAHRGQHRTHPSIAGVSGAGDPQLTTPGVPRADVWVFDALNPGGDLGGSPLAILSFFSDTPRALATDGTTVYVAAFHSGNQTTAIPEPAVPDGFATSCGPGGVGVGVPGPSVNVDGTTAPETGVIVRFDGASWRDALGCRWDSAVQFSLPDHDVFAFDANSLASGVVFDHVGTTLFNMALNPQTGKLYVSNTDSRNEVRFEGPGTTGGSTVQGHLAETRISVLTPGGPAVDPQHLNQHIDYTRLHTDVGADHAAIEAQKAHSLATPLQIVVSDEPGDQTVYVAAYGSSRVGVYAASALEDPAYESNFDPSAVSGGHLETGGGPAGLALSADNARLYVYTRFDHSISLFDVKNGTGRVQTVRLPSAEPESIVSGRPLLYDAVATSGNGEAACASCHVFGDFDSLGWNLGNPDDLVTDNPQQVTIPLLPAGTGPDFHPMKGPMTTQTLRGLSTHGGMHWRGDRTNGFFNPAPSPCLLATDGDCDEQLSFDNFIVAFEALLGHDGLIATADMQRFTDFALQLMTRPNPVAPIDGPPTAAQAAGAAHYGTLPADAGVTCNACHVLDPAQGFFGSGGTQTFEGEPQVFKVAQLRNAYQKIGMFGLIGATAFQGDQVRGFGFLHDGAVDTLENFLDVGPFNLNAGQIAELEQFMLAFPSDVSPIVGQQSLVGPEQPGSFTSPGVNARLDTLNVRAGRPFDSAVLGGTVTECELIVKSVDGGVQRGWSRQQPTGFMRPDDGGADVDESILRARADPNGEGLGLVYTCVMPGSGLRMGIDRDLDGALDGQDNCPAWPNASGNGTCTAGDPALTGDRCLTAADCGVAGVCSAAQEDTDGDGLGDACEVMLVPEPASFVGLALGALSLIALSGYRSSEPRIARARRR
jgi:DNA-binding beta-propeller fold protein YncE